MLVSDSMTTLAPITVPAPIFTSGPITAPGPTSTLVSSSARLSMTAEGWIRPAIELAPRLPSRTIPPRPPARRRRAPPPASPQWSMKFQNFYFHAKLIAGDYAAPKAHFVQSGQHEQACRVSADFVQREDCARLRQRFDDQHSRHHGMPRKVTGEVRFVEGDVLDRYDAALDQLDDSIDEQERIAMGQQPQYALEIRDFRIFRHRKLLRAQPTSRWSISWPHPIRSPTAATRPDRRSRP